MQQTKVGEQKLFSLFGHFSVLLVLSFTLLDAGSFSDFKRSQSKSFQAYQDERDNAFDKYLKQQWQAYEVFNGKPLYEKAKPKNITPAKLEKQKPVGPKVRIKVIPAKVKKEEKDFPKEIEKVEQKRDIYFEYFGANLGFDIPKGIKQANFYPQSQKGIESFFRSVATSDYDGLLNDLKKVSIDMNLNDWAIYLLVSKLSNNIFANEDNSRLFNWFILNKMGYAVKIGLSKKHVVLMHYSEKVIYSTPSYNFDNKKYYVLSNYAKGKVGRVFSYKQDYPGSTKALDLSLSSLPILPLDIKSKTIGFNNFGNEYKVPFQYNKNMIDFMSTYPQADYQTYFNAPIDHLTYKGVASALKKYLDGKKASEAMNLVLTFVQKSFEYKRDNEQFGREKVMFAQETLYFDKSDCEDRAVLYSYLVKELFHVPVIGVKYKDHMTTAIYVPMQGSSVKVGSRKFIIADPTYINASIGMSMPSYRSIKPERYIEVKKD